MLKAFALLMVALFLAGCTMPKTAIYSIAIPHERGLQKAEPRFSLTLHVDSPRYLAQPYIASRTSPFELELSRYAKWDTPPREIVTETLRSSLLSTGLFSEVRMTNVTPGDSYSLRVDLRRFESLDEGQGPSGEVLLRAELSSPQGRELLHRTLGKRAKLDGPGFLNLAKGLSSALGESVEELTRLVAETMKSQQTQ